MAKGFDVLNVKSAVKARNKFDLSRTHLTTMDFGEIVPLFCEETVPGDDIKVNANYFSRMAPLALPTYGKFSFKTMASFVPYHQVAEDADAWFAGKITWEGMTTKFRHITLLGLVDFMLASGVSSTAVDGVTATSANCDFNYVATDGSTRAYRLFTKAGKYYMKVLNALGYAIPEGINLKTTSDWYKNEGGKKLSALPLLAFFKAYNDYMSQSQRYNINALTAFLKGVKHNSASDTYYDATTGKIKGTGIKLMFDNLKLNYENDYFTSAWQNPNSPITRSEDSSLGSELVPGTLGAEFVQANDRFNSLTTYNADGSQTTISQRAIDFLKSFDDWVRRNNYSGSRAVQQVYSRFGIKTDDYRSNYAHILGTDIMPIQVGDVTSVADTTGAVLGEYAGKGIMNGSKFIECKADDYGLLVILGYFTVTPMNAYGFDKKVLRNSPLDYYNPEFDGIGAEAISAGELFATPIVSPLTDTTSDSDVFGYTERYNSYRYGRDVITGDFRNFHDNEINAWHTGRLLGDVRLAGNLVAQSSAMNTLEQTDSQFNRIFSDTGEASGVNHFYLTAQFGVDAYRPMYNLNQVVKLGEGDTSVPRNGNVVS